MRTAFLLLFSSLLLMAAPAAGSGQDAAPLPVSIQIEMQSPVRTLRGGLGASWHAIERPMIGTGEIRQGALGGSAWGGNPPADDEAAWRTLYRHARWLGLDWMRVEIEQRMYEPARGRFDWDNAEMRILYRILDWAEENGADVFLQQMWGNVAWNAYPELRSSPERIAVSAPYSMEDFAEGLAELIEHLLRVKGYRCIRWLAINNEPGHDWSWWQGPDLEPLPITPGLRAVRDALDKRGLYLPLSGPDWTLLPELEPDEIDFDPYIGAYDIHSYDEVFDDMERRGGKKLTAAERIIGDWARWAHARGKPLFLSEVGTMAYGWGGSNPAPGSYESGLKNASLAIRAINAGADAVNRWSFTNRGDLDGQWQLVDTWDIERERLLEEFAPHPNAYYQWGILTRFTAKNSEVLPTQVRGEWPPSGRRLVAAALRSPRKGEITILLTNEMRRDASLAVRLHALPHGIWLYRYAVTPAERDKVPVELAPSDRLLVDTRRPEFQDRVPALSIVVYSTHHLRTGEPGIITD